ncbi:MAG TPA: YIP1 family protein [Chthoniobacterales bacterium]
MSIIHLNRAGQNLGTFSLEEVQKGLDAGRFLGSDLGWRTGMENWKPLSQWPDLTVPPATPEVPEPVHGFGGGSGGSGGLEPASVASGFEPTIADGSVKDGPSWEQRATLGFPKAMVLTIKEVLIEPAPTFERMKTEGGLGSPFFFYFAIGLLTNLIGLAAGMVWQLIFASIAGTQNQQLPQALQQMGLSMTAFIVIALFGLPISLVIGSFVGSGLLHLSLMLVGGATKPFEATYRTWNYAAGAVSATSLVAVIPFCGSVISMIALPVWYLVCATIGISKVHSIPTGKAFLAVFLPFLLCCGCAVGLWTIALGPTIMEGIKNAR